MARAITPVVGRTRLAWLLPLAVFVVVLGSSDGQLSKLIGAIVGLAVLVLVVRRPAAAFLVLIAVLPFQVLLLAAAYRYGVPQSLVRVAASYRDLIVIGILIAGISTAIRERHRLDVLDKMAIAYVGIVTLYLLFPAILVRAPSNDFPGPPLDTQVRLLAYRVDIGFVLLMLGMRHIAFDPRLRDRVLKVLVVVGTIVAAVAIFEFSFSSTWNDFAVNTIRLPRYEVEVLNTTVPNPIDIRQTVIVAGHDFTRPGSTMFNPLEAGFYLVIGLGAGLELLVRQRARASVLATVGIAIGLLFTYVRSAAIGALVLGFFAIRPGPGRSQATRARMTLLLAGGLIVLLPAAAATGLAARSSGAVSGTDTSTTLHFDSLNAGVDALGTDPMGRGLGTQPGVGDRFKTKTKLTSENAYLQVGNELGIPAMVVFVLLIIVLLRRLHRAVIRAPDDALTSAAWAITAALAIGGLFLHVWNYFSVSLTVWGVAGLVIGIAERSGREPAPAPVPAAVAV